jgi:hypothetical protein
MENCNETNDIGRTMIDGEAVGKRELIHSLAKDLSIPARGRDRVRIGLRLQALGWSEDKSKRWFQHSRNLEADHC